MKLARYLDSGEERIGSVEDGFIVPVGLNSDDRGPSMLDVIRAGNAKALTTDRSSRVRLADVELLAPTPASCRNVFCVGKNYEKHAREFDRSGFDTSSDAGQPTAPIIFTKTPESLVAHGDPICWDRSVTSALDYEAELAVIIARAGKHIVASEAHTHIFGFTILNDVTARDLQSRHGQWFLGKSLDRSSPLGPWIVTSDEFHDVEPRIQCFVNDELRQDSIAEHMIFNVGTLIESISAGTTLLPGDIIGTGTPSGVGAGFSPARFLQAGDQVRIQIAGIGTLANSVVIHEQEN